MKHGILISRIILPAVIWVMFSVLAFGACETITTDSHSFTVKLQINKPYCILNFMETLRTRGYWGPTLYEHYKKSKYNENEQLSGLVKQYSNVKTAYSYQLDGYPKYRFAATNKATSDLFFTLSARTNSLKELEQMTVGIIPLVDHQRLFDVLKAVEPIYDELVWKPYYDMAKIKLKDLKQYADKVSLSSMPRPVAHFLNSSWPTDIPLIVTFSIVPGEKIRIVPPPLGNVIRAGLLTESEDYSWYVALIMHEFTHRAFAEQPLEKHKQVDKWLTDSKSPHRGMVNLMFDEVLAGAVGHKVREDLLGHAHDFTYGQGTVKAMDEAVYPLVVSYLEKDRSVDKVFVDECLAIYDRTFPNTLYEYPSLFQVYYLLTDLEGDQARSLPRMIRKNIVGPMMYELGSGIVDENIDALMAYEFTKVIVITKDHKKNVEYLKSRINILDNYDSLDSYTNWVLSCHDGQRNPYIIVNIQSADLFEEVTKMLKEKAVIDPKKAILWMEQ